MKKWISKVIKHPGALHRTLGVPKGKKIPIARLRSVAKQKGVTGRRARLAITLRSMRKRR